jgi:hypothetical protein
MTPPDHTGVLIITFTSLHIHQGRNRDDKRNTAGSQRSAHSTVKNILYNSRYFSISLLSYIHNLNLKENIAWTNTSGVKDQSFASANFAFAASDISSGNSSSNNPATFLPTNPPANAPIMKVITVVAILGKIMLGAITRTPLTRSRIKNKANPWRSTLQNDEFVATPQMAPVRKIQELRGKQVQKPAQKPTQEREKRMRFHARNI